MAAIACRFVSLPTADCRLPQAFAAGSRQKRLRFLGPNVVGEDTMTHLPAFVQLEPVGQCNLRCQMCSIQFRADGPPQSPPAFMSLGTFTRLVDEFGAIEQLYLEGLGEPIMHPHLTSQPRSSPSRARSRHSPSAPPARLRWLSARCRAARGSARRCAMHRWNGRRSLPSHLSFLSIPNPQCNAGTDRALPVPIDRRTHQCVP